MENHRKSNNFNSNFFKIHLFSICPEVFYHIYHLFVYLYIHFICKIRGKAGKVSLLCRRFILYYSLLFSARNEFRTASTATPTSAKIASHIGA